MQAGAVAIADENIGSGAFLQHVGKILAGHQRRRRCVHRIGPGDVGGDPGAELGLRRVVDGDRVIAIVIDPHMRAMGGGDPLRDLADPGFGEFPQFERQGPDRSRHDGLVRDHIVGEAGMELGDGDDQRLQRIGIARDDRLQSLDDGRADDDRIDRAMRQGGMASAPVDGDHEFVRRGHDRAAPHSEPADRHARQIVHAVDAAERQSLEQPVIDHRLGPGAAFFRRLEDQRHGSVEGTCFTETAAGGEQHRRMAVMAAGMHHAGHLGRVGDACLLGDRQCVHVGAKADHRPAGTASAMHQTHDTRPAHSGDHLVAAEVAQLAGNEGRGLVDLVEQFGTLVQVLAPAGDLRLGIRDSVVDRHGRLSDSLVRTYKGM